MKKRNNRYRYRIPRKLKKGLKWSYLEQMEVQKLFDRYQPKVDKYLLITHGVFKEDFDLLLNEIARHIRKHRMSKWEKRANRILADWHEIEWSEGYREICYEYKWTQLLNDYWNFLTKDW